MLRKRIERIRTIKASRFDQPSLSSNSSETKAKLQVQRLPIHYLAKLPIHRSAKSQNLELKASLHIHI